MTQVVTKKPMEIAIGQSPFDCRLFKKFEAPCWAIHGPLWD